MGKKTGVPIKPYRLDTYESFAKFTATPWSFRQEEYGFKTNKGFSEKNDITAVQLAHWRADEKFWETVKKYLKQWGRDRTPNVISGLYRRASRSGTAAEAKLWMQVIEDWKEKVENVQDNLTRKTLQDIRDNIRKVVDGETNKSKK